MNLDLDIADSGNVCRYTDVFGKQCHDFHKPYSKLRMRVDIRVKEIKGDLSPELPRWTLNWSCFPKPDSGFGRPFLL